MVLFTSSLELDLLQKAWSGVPDRQSENALYGRRNFLRPVGDVNGRFGSRADDVIEHGDEGIAVLGIEALARFVEDQKFGPLYERASQKHQALVACGQLEQGS